MNKNVKSFMLFTLVLTVTVVVSQVAFAADDVAGSGFLSDFKGAVTGSMGTTAGLVVSLVGLYMWIWNQVSWGIIVALAGAMFTAFPGIYSNIGGFGDSLFGGSVMNSTDISDTAKNVGGNNG